MSKITCPFCQHEFARSAAGGAAHCPKCQQTFFPGSSADDAHDGLEMVGDSDGLEVVGESAPPLAAASEPALRPIDDDEDDNLELRLEAADTQVMSAAIKDDAATRLATEKAREEYLDSGHSKSGPTARQIAAQALWGIATPFFGIFETIVVDGTFSYGRPPLGALQCFGVVVLLFATPAVFVTEATKRLLYLSRALAASTLLSIGGLFMLVSAVKSARDAGAENPAEIAFTPTLVVLVIQLLAALALLGYTHRDWFIKKK